MPFPARHLLALCAALCGTAQAEVYRCLDESGRAQYTNVRADTQGRNCTLVQGQVSSVPSSAPAPSAATPGRPVASPATKGSDTQRVDPNTQRARDNSRRKILEDELSAEQRSLAQARQDLATQEQTRNGDERNYQRVLDRLKPYQEAVERHERNINALQKELSNTK